MKRNILAICLLILVFTCLGLIACKSGGGSGSTAAIPTGTPSPDETAQPTPDPTPTPSPADTANTAECFKQIGGTWNYATFNETGTITISPDGKNVTGMTMSSCPTGLSVNSVTSSVFVSGDEVFMIFSATCSGYTYSFNMIMKYVDGKCTSLSGQRADGHAGGEAESISMQKQ